MKTIFIILALFFVVVLQTTFIPKLAIYGVFPNLMLVLVIFKSLFKDYKEIFIWPLAGGLILDISSSFPFGVFTLSFLIISIITSFISRNIWTSENVGLVIVLITFLGSFSFGFLTANLAKLGYLLMNLSWALNFKQLLVITSCEAIYNVILAVILLLVLKKIQLLGKTYVNR